MILVGDKWVKRHTICSGIYKRNPIANGHMFGHWLRDCVTTVDLPWRSFGGLIECRQFKKIIKARRSRRDPEGDEEQCDRVLAWEKYWDTNMKKEDGHRSTKRLTITSHRWPLRRITSIVRWVWQDVSKWFDTNTAHRLAWLRDPLLVSWCITANPLSLQVISVYHYRGRMSD